VSGFGMPNRQAKDGQDERFFEPVAILHQIRFSCSILEGRENRTAWRVELRTWVSAPEVSADVGAMASSRVGSSSAGLRVDRTLRPLASSHRPTYAAMLTKSLLTKGMSRTTSNVIGTPLATPISQDTAAPIGAKPSECDAALRSTPFRFPRVTSLEPKSEA
jgi:hypothetical protein